jgi:hypothetical protein
MRTFLHPGRKARHVGGVSITVNPMNPPQVEPAPIFRAFQERKPSRRRWVVLAALPVVAGLAGWALTQGQAGALQVATPRGVKTVRRGMSPQQVVGILGKPLTLVRSADGLSDCYRYGTPSLTKEKFLVYSACFESGELQDVTVRHYEAWDLDPSILPVMESAPAAPTPVVPTVAPAPASPVSPSR